LAGHHRADRPCRPAAGAGAGGLGDEPVRRGAAGRDVVGDVEDELAPVGHARHCPQNDLTARHAAVLLPGVTFTDPPPTPLPDGYSLAELDHAADRAAMEDIDRWAFAFEHEPEDEPARVWTLEPGRSVGVWHEGARGATLA